MKTQQFDPQIPAVLMGGSVTELSGQLNKNTALTEGHLDLLKRNRDGSEMKKKGRISASIVAVGYFLCPWPTSSRRHHLSWMKPLYDFLTITSIIIAKEEQPFILLDDLMATYYSTLNDAFSFFLFFFGL